jgi:hypothetical protein
VVRNSTSHNYCGISRSEDDEFHHCMLCWCMVEMRGIGDAMRSCRVSCGRKTGNLSGVAGGDKLQAVGALGVVRNI